MAGNKKIKSSDLSSLEECSEESSESINNVFHDIEVLELNGNEDEDFRALARIKLEDLEVQESLLELEGEFNKFIVEHVEECGIVEDQEYDHTVVALEDEDFEIEESLLQKILDFFSQLYQDTEDYIDLDYELDPLKRRKKKKKFILEAIIEFLKKLLRSGKSLNLKELLDLQILELQERLAKEEDPDLRKLLQERLILLTELRAQMMQSGIGANLLRFFLLASFISSLLGLQQDAYVTREGTRSRDALGLFVQKQEEKALDEKSVSADASKNIVADHFSSFIVSGYVQDVFLGKVQEMSYKLHDQYFMALRDMSYNIGTQHGMQGVFLAVVAIMSAINAAFSKVTSFFRRAIDKLDAFERSVRSRNNFVNDVHDVKSSASPVVCNTDISFTQSNNLHYSGGIWSSLSYHSELKVSCSGIYNSSYLEDIRVIQCQVQNSSVSR
ncbi:hypothetical protein [Ehrlichia canis]|uniref:Uncharacterized protein n=1 Tax=Ehrlichia canis (strain Jake) TaxID=269484 RepID=A0ACA6AX48_EHRCJ|nr:hypothetical protein [Ehrlichia canis]AAZ68574.1 hypothetical protein Ecaj_0538 [Ehrlichia canis str. Jake]